MRPAEGRLHSAGERQALSREWARDGRSIPSMSDRNLETRLSALARAGLLDDLMELVDAHPSEDPDEIAYKWLNVAADFGSEDAVEMIDAVLDGALHADDDNYVTGHVHFELAVAYLTGTEGLPTDHDKGRKHIHEMLSRHYPSTVQGGADLLSEAREKMEPAGRAVFDTALATVSSAAPQQRR
jgi:hypothetical protein